MSTKKSVEKSCQLEEALKAKSEEVDELKSKFVDLINNSPVGVYSIEVNGKDQFVEVNPALVNILQADSKDHLLSTSLSGLYHDSKKNADFIDKVVKKGAVKDEVLELNTLKGQKIIGAFSMVAKKNKNGVTTLDGCVQDITKQRDIESVLEAKIKERTGELEQANKKLLEVRQALLTGMEDLNHQRSLAEVERAKDEAVLNSIGSGIVVTDTEGVITKANRSFFEMFQLEKDAVVGRSIKDVITAENEEGGHLDLDVECKTLKENGDTNPEPLRVNCFIVRKDRTRLPVLIISTPIKANGVIGMVRTFTDTTQEFEIERQKNEFLSIASHQLRTPLSITKWTLDVCMQEKGLTDKQNERFNDLYSSNERLIMLVNDLLRGVKIEKNSTALKRVSVDIISLIQDLIDSVEPAVKKKNQTLNIVLDVTSATSLIDAALFSEVLSNLLDNAHLYAQEGALIEVRLTQQDEKFYRVSVHNSGSFIPDVDRDHLFTKFYRGVNSRKMVGAGTGLGLYIAKSAAEANGGKIWFESTAESGTTFYFTIPRIL